MHSTQTNHAKFEEMMLGNVNVNNRDCVGSSKPNPKEKVGEILVINDSSKQNS